ncbi:MAG TPA: tetratricopeptide repeat protein [Vicinamibacterales bacterium]
MAIDRVALLRHAETLVQQGKLDQAIAEYRRIVNDQPHDWNTANALGDLYLRNGQTDKAVELFVRVADSLSQDGVLPKAAALYKKILKLRPHDEHVLLQAADIAAGQGLLAEARAHLNTVNEQRRSGGDASGVVDPEAFISKVTAARRLSVDNSPALEPRSSDSHKVPPVVPADPVVVAPATASTHALSIPKNPVDNNAVPREIEKRAASMEEPAATIAQSPGGGQPKDLEDIFADLRKEASHRFVTNNHGDELLAGLALYDAGQLDFAVPRLEAALHGPTTRFRAAAALGHISLQRGDTWRAIDWFERAAEAAAPTPEDGHRLLYELADALENVGEVARSLAICLELRADAGDYQDVEERVERLTKVQARG